MGDFEVPVSLPLDADGFLRRECPTCEREFKWFVHAEGSPDAEQVGQYFCPLCGLAAGVDSWWTPAQLAYAQGVAGPEFDRLALEAIDDALRGIKGLAVKPNRNFSLGLPAPEPLTEPSDMLIVEPPCHSHEPVKIPEEAGRHVYCLICGSLFAT